MSIFDIFLKPMTTVTINGKTYSGKNITVTSDGNVIVDGSRHGSVAGPVNVVVHGACESVSTVSGDIQVNGDVNGGDVSTTNGDITVNGNVSANKVKTTNGDIVAKGQIGTR